MVGCAPDPPPVPPDAAAADGGSDAADAPPMPAGLLQINEICPDDDGVMIDELGQTDDWIELRNTGSIPVELGRFTLSDGGKQHGLPAVRLSPGELVLLWADGSPEQGARHLDFRLTARGGRVELRDLAGKLIDSMVYPALETNVAYGRFPDGSAQVAECRYATPGRLNGPRCGPPPPPELPEEVQFAEFDWPPGWNQPAGPLVVTEAALRPASFVEVTNTGAAALPLADFVVRLAATAPGSAWPAVTEGVELRWPRSGSIAPGEHLVLAVTDAEVAGVFPSAAALQEMEGVLTVFRRAGGAAVQRVDFMRWPEGAVLALAEDDAGGGLAYRLCRARTPGQANGSCRPLPIREVGDRLRQLLTEDDLRALGEGGTALDTLASKVIVDMEAGDAVHFLSARSWDLHYTFIRERIYRQPHLDRCNPQDAEAFDTAWREFSDREYFQTTGRRFLLGTLVRYGGSGVQTLEFDRSDAISAEQMRRAFFAVAARTTRPLAWAVRAQGPQVSALKAIEGSLPLLDPNAPFRGLSFQPLTPAVGFGTLRFFPAADLARARLGQDVIAVTDDVPNDLPFIGGLMTEVFQTPLSHVGVLTRNRGTPNMALKSARQDPRLVPLFGKLVRLEVSSGDFSIREATAAEAQAFWDSRRPSGPRLAPRLDASVRGLQDLRDHGLDRLPAIGAKAAQLAELMRVRATEAECLGAVPVPAVAWAIPVAHYLDHFEASGGRTLLEGWRAQPAFATDPAVRGQGLEEVRAAILAHPVDTALLAAVEAAAGNAFGPARFRLRSSSNTEDLPTFSGAGLYTSVSAALGDPDRVLANGLRTVWASLWSERAWDERERGNIDQSLVAMAVLIHQAYHGVERANGVAVSRDIRDPIHASRHYLNAQAGEASVTNPAPGVTSEQMTFEWWRQPPINYLSHSSLTTAPVLQPAEVSRIACLMRAVHAHFQPLIDPTGSNRWFTMESEFKLVGPERSLVLKQARPYSFGPVTIPQDCREL